MDTKYVQIGRTRKPHGLDGKLKLEIKDCFVDDLLQKKVLFIEIRGQKIPYFVQDLQTSDFFLLKLEEIDDREMAALLKDKFVYLRRADISISDEEIGAVGLLYGHLQNYLLIEENHGILGKIEDIVKYPQQEMALIYIREQEVLIPLNKAYIQEEKTLEKQVILSLPEGFLDLYFS